MTTCVPCDLRHDDPDKIGGCVCGCHDEPQQPTAAQQIIALLTEIRDDQRAQSQPGQQSPGPEVGIDVIRSVAAELNAAAEALEQSAKQLKEDGKGWRAGHAHAAALRAAQAAQDLLGG